MGIPVTGKQRRPEVLVEETGRNSRVTGVTYDPQNDLYLISYEGQKGVTLYDPTRKYIVRVIGKKASAPVVSMASCPANQIIGKFDI